MAVVGSQLVGKLLGWVFKEDKSPPVTLNAALRSANAAAWGQLQTAVQAQPQRVRVLAIEAPTKAARALQLEVVEGEPIAYRAGQFLTCCFDIDGEEVRRAYSIASAPESGDLRICIKSLAEGRVSNYVQTALRPGDEFKVIGPSGDFVLPESLQAAVFIAGGSGITPIFGMLDSLLRRHPQTAVTLIYQNRREADIIFHAELEALAAAFPNLQIQHLLSRPAKSWKGMRGRLDEALLGALLSAEQLQSADFFLCGPDALMQMAQAHLLESGVAPARLHSERFLPAAKAKQPHPTSPQTIRFQRSARSVQAQPGQSLLEAGLAAGVAMPFSCQVGGCGHCRVKLLAGEVVSDEPNCLSKEEHQQGYRLACLSYACAEVTLDV